ncbi:hypothetical protein ABIB40_002332 [Pedobacter sp. UYP30]|uniref:hypothetical protein n=1 Tax=Pedobacter sp. UYP30 TaxID=1756400 RepID=UPI0033922267
MNPIKSTGKCLYCKETFLKAGIGRHLQKHLQEKFLLSKPGNSFLLKVEENPKWETRPYFLILWIDGETKINELDDFLRQIWLECCGHMSSFTNSKMKKQNGSMFDFFDAGNLLEQGKVKQYEKLMEENCGEVAMSKKAKKTLAKGLKLIYQYDFGSTTELQVTVLNDYPIQADDRIVLLSRNEPLGLLCDLCGKKLATQICSICCSNSDEAYFCTACSKKHAKTCPDFEDYAKLPMVNSPRMGVCAYEGGSIDKERDGN